MKRVPVVLALLMLVTISVACGPSDSPEKAAKEWTEALLNLDGNKLVERTCVAQRENVQEAGLLLSAFLGLGQMLSGLQLELEADISDLHFSTISKSGNSAQVRVYGEIRTAVLAVGQAMEIDETYSMVQEGGKWKWCGEAGGTQVATPALLTQPTVAQPAIVSEIDILPFWYEVREGEEGWMEGIVHLGIVIPGDHPARQVSVDIEEIVLETQEGKTYPAGLYKRYERYGWMVPDDWEGTNRIDISSSMPLPTNLLIYSATDAKELDQTGHTVSHAVFFRFAKAAHPTRVILRSASSEHVLDLPAPSWSGAVPSQDISARPINDLAYELSQLNPKLQIKFKECKCWPGSWCEQILEVTNTNLFDEEKAERNNNLYAIYTSEGKYVAFDSSEDGILSRFSAGPGATIDHRTHRLGMGLGHSLYLILYKDSPLELEIFKLPEECSSY